ncbi:MAG: M48 family metallopeptidase, partial [Rhodospirillales bacterium]|nr:M48 family metallopeptidase [Rhodospirillales bacterium]
MSILPTHLPRLIRPLAVAVLLATSLAGCVTNPVTGRQGLLLLSEDEERTLGLQSFEEVMRSERLSRDPAATALVQRVGQRIAAATGRNDYQWEFRLVDKADINAFCLPGGKVVVYTGILPVSRDEAGLAAVVGHEVAHAIARHGGERVSQELLVGVGVAAVSAAVSRGDEAMSDNVAALLGAGAALGYTLPFSRGQESEAD